MASKQANAKLALRITSGVFRFVLNVLFYVIVITCIITFSKAAFNFSYQVFGDVTVDEEPKREVKIRIVSGESTMTVARKLEQNKIIVDDTTFYLKAKLSKVNIMPGTYVVNSAMTYEEIFEELSDVNNSLTTDEYQEEEEKDADQDSGQETDSKTDQGTEQQNSEK